MTQVRIRRTQYTNNVESDSVIDRNGQHSADPEKFVLRSNAGCEIVSEEALVVGGSDSAADKGLQDVVTFTVSPEKITLLLKATSLLIVLAGVVQLTSVVVAQKAVATEIMSLIAVVVGLLVMISTIDMFVRG